MTVCIDTNVALQLFATSHPHHIILEAWSRGLFHWSVTTEIFLEYEAVMLQQGSVQKAAKMRRIMDMMSDRHGNLNLVSPTCRFHTITGDADDDKFADCAIAAEG